MEPKQISNPELASLADLSYSEQYDRLYQKDLDTKTVILPA